jgi:hypothetical protein
MPSVPIAPILPIVPPIVVPFASHSEAEVVPFASHSEAELGVLDFGSIVMERGSTGWHRSQCGDSYRYRAEGCDTGFHDFVLWAPTREESIPDA